MIIFFKKINIILNSIGINIFKSVRATISLSFFFKDYLSFKKNSTWKHIINPQLFDKGKEGAIYGEYFFQDLYVAKAIIRENPQSHIDIGSRVDGFIGILSLNRSVDVFDIRPINIKIENIKFHQYDITKHYDNFNNTSDCISCLHTIEHFGLGRYGDEVDSNSWKLAFKNMSLILKINGIFWLSTPIGIERVEFNANRVFNPNTIIDFAIGLNLQLEEFAYFINDNVIKSDNIINDLSKLSNLDYSLGIFKFRKINNL